MKETRTIPTNFNEQKVTCKTKNFHIFLAFLLINITLLIAVSIYQNFIKSQAKRKHMLPYRTTNKKLKEVHINKCIINMESNAKFKKLLLKFARYYFDDIIKIEDFDLENYLTYKNTYENILL